MLGYGTRARQGLQQLPVSTKHHAAKCTTSRSEVNKEQAREGGREGRQLYGLYSIYTSDGHKKLIYDHACTGCQYMEVQRHNSST